MTFSLRSFKGYLHNSPLVRQSPSNVRRILEVDLQRKFPRHPISISCPHSTTSAGLIVMATFALLLDFHTGTVCDCLTLLHISIVVQALVLLHVKASYL